MRFACQTSSACELNPLRHSEIRVGCFLPFQTVQGSIFPLAVSVNCDPGPLHHMCATTGLIFLSPPPYRKLFSSPCTSASPALLFRTQATGQSGPFLAHPGLLWGLRIGWVCLPSWPSWSVLQAHVASVGEQTQRTSCCPGAGVDTTGHLAFLVTSLSCPWTRSASSCGH